MCEDRAVQTNFQFISMLCGSVWSMSVCIYMTFSGCRCQKTINTRIHLFLSSPSTLFWLVQSLVVRFDLHTDCLAYIYCKVTYITANLAFIIGAIFTFLSIRIYRD